MYILSIIGTQIKQFIFFNPHAVGRKTKVNLDLSNFLMQIPQSISLEMSTTLF